MTLSQSLSPHLVVVVVFVVFVVTVMIVHHDASNDNDQSHAPRVVAVPATLSVPTL